MFPRGAAFELRQGGKAGVVTARSARSGTRWIVDIAGQRWEVRHLCRARGGALGNGVIALLVGGLLSALVLLTLFVLAREAGRAERKAAESEQRFAQAFEHAPVGMALLDRLGRHVKVNQAHGGHARAHARRDDRHDRGGHHAVR